MKKLVGIALVGLFGFGLIFNFPKVDAKVSVRGYVNNHHTYVAPHIRTSPNRSLYDNYSTKGNYNPYTGKVGTKNPYR